MTGLAAIPVTIAIIAASAFFVATEFSVIAARRTRLEAAAADSRSARAALRSASEVPLLLAGSQLGITACTLALGAVTKPAVDHALEPVLERVGLPAYAAAPASFALALLLVTFLHLVVGEMAPKSWAISHPERSATLLALPMRGFMWTFRPALHLLNEAANRLVQRLGVEPKAEVAIEQDPDDLRELVRHSAETGELDAGSSEQLVSALETSRATVDQVVGDRELVVVESGASVAEVHEQARSSGHLRVLVGNRHAPTGVVHVRDTLTAGDDDPVDPFVRDLHRLDGSTTVLEALSELREQGTQIALVVREGASPAVVTIADLLSRLMPATARAEQVVSD